MLSAQSAAWAREQQIVLPQIPEGADEATSGDATPAPLADPTDLSDADDLAFDPARSTPLAPG